ncbi:MAG: hypothetical protein KKD69_05805 [Euryarchaeota archaeon]|nr:hypothetical protein [Euryarchaeota archaeon]MBU4491960.1 hypothetical protein [Euryarchaeota archaeon]
MRAYSHAGMNLKTLKEIIVQQKNELEKKESGLERESLKGKILLSEF